MALKNHPDLFFDNYISAKKYSDEVWKKTLDGNGKQVFGLFNEEELIGITAIFTCVDDPTKRTGLFAMSYILPEYRNKGLVDLFFKSRIGWAKTNTIFNKIKVSHREGNIPSRKAIIKWGFDYIGKNKIKWPDGACDYDYEYELTLNNSRPLIIK